jgi:lipopolysaccharide/colanic/teichoic acid biosynthesis glycosyltransferase
VYCGIAFLASLLVFQWFQTSTPIARYFSIKDALDLLKACILVTALSAVLAFLFTRLNEAPRSIPVLQLILLTAALTVGRLFSGLQEARRETKTRTTTKPVQHVLVIQASRLAWFFSKIIEDLVPGEYQIVAILDERPNMQHRSLNGYPIIGSPTQIERIVDEYALHGIRIDKVIVATKPDDLSKDAWEEISLACRARQIELEVLPDRLLSGLTVATEDAPAAPYVTESIPRASSSLEALLTRQYWKFKRIIDILVASTVLVLTFPVTVVVFVLALVDVGTPVIFWQQRAGRHGTPLHLYKFRTLQTLFDRRTNERRELPEPSSIGRSLRKTRLDEIPQLWNILCGDMSLIGPRPLLPVDQPNEATMRLAVRPGLSGWAQVCGGKLISPEEKNALDEWYIRHASLWLDTVIVLRTIWTLIIGDRRDEKAISMALAARFEGKIIELSTSLTSERMEERSGLIKRAEAMRLADAACSSSDRGRVPTRSDSPTARSALSKKRLA